MSCDLHATHCPSPLSPPHPNPIPYCPDFSLEFPAFERDYMGLRHCIKQAVAGTKIPDTSSPIHRSSLADDLCANDGLCGSHLKLAPPSSAAGDVDVGNADGEDPLSANIGWPPMSSYRKSTTRALCIKPPCSIETTPPLTVHEAPLEEATNNGTDVDEKHEASAIMNMKTSLRKPLHIKVSMDGTPIMRKLNLDSMQGYQHLFLELHKLFKFYKRHLYCEVGVHSCFKDLNGASFIVTYKDRDRGWMLVGDTPWEDFARLARRIRIMKQAM